MYEEELWALVLNHKAGDMELYKELKSIYTDKEWMKEREIVFSKLSRYRGIDKYENTIKAMATNTSGRAHYREIVSILRRMKKYPKGKEKILEYIYNVLTLYIMANYEQKRYVVMKFTHE